METGTFYHYYNRANNRENLFKEKDNYRYFLQLLKKHIVPVADVYSYCLLPNHFHLVIKTKEESELPVQIRNGKRGVSQAFSNLFNAYAKAYNLKYERRGSLFQKHPKHKEITNNKYLCQLILYVNTNSGHHAVSEPELYEYSSFHALLGTGSTLVMRKEVHELFGDLQSFRDCLDDKNRRIELAQESFLEDGD